MTNLKILLDITNLKHLKEKSCYNHNFYEIITQSYGSMLFGNNILEEECHEDEDYCTFSLGHFEGERFIPVLRWDGEYGENLENLVV